MPKIWYKNNDTVKLVSLSSLLNSAWPSTIPSGVKRRIHRHKRMVCLSSPAPLHLAKWRHSNIFVMDFTPRCASSNHTIGKDSEYGASLGLMKLRFWRHWWSMQNMIHLREWLKISTTWIRLSKIHSATMRSTSSTSLHTTSTNTCTAQHLAVSSSMLCIFQYRLPLIKCCVGIAISLCCCVCIGWLPRI